MKKYMILRERERERERERKRKRKREREGTKIPLQLVLLVLCFSVINFHWISFRIYHWTILKRILKYNLCREKCTKKEKAYCT